MGSNLFNPAAIQAVEGDMLRMCELCDHESSDHIFTIEERSEHVTVSLEWRKRGVHRGWV
jgi:hypothetical protein